MSSNQNDFLTIEDADDLYHLEFTRTPTPTDTPFSDKRTTVYVDRNGYVQVFREPLKAVSGKLCSEEADETENNGSDRICMNFQGQLIPMTEKEEETGDCTVCGETVPVRKMWVCTSCTSLLHEIVDSDAFDDETDSEEMCADCVIASHNGHCVKKFEPDTKVSAEKAKMVEYVNMLEQLRESCEVVHQKRMNDLEEITEKLRSIGDDVPKESDAWENMVRVFKEKLNTAVLDVGKWYFSEMEDTIPNECPQESEENRSLLAEMTPATSGDYLADFEAAYARCFQDMSVDDSIDFDSENENEDGVEDEDEVDYARHFESNDEEDEIEEEYVEEPDIEVYDFEEDDDDILLNSAVNLSTSRNEWIREAEEFLREIQAARQQNLQNLRNTETTDVVVVDEIYDDDDDLEF